MDMGIVKQSSISSALHRQHNLANLSAASPKFVPGQAFRAGGSSKVRFSSSIPPPPPLPQSSCNSRFLIRSGPTGNHQSQQGLAALRRQNSALSFGGTGAAPPHNRMSSPIFAIPPATSPLAPTTTAANSSNPLIIFTSNRTALLPTVKGNNIAPISMGNPSSCTNPTSSRNMPTITILVNHQRNGGDDPSLDQLPPHPLQDVWTFWYLRFEKNFSWEHSQLEIGTANSVEQFWGIFDQLLPLTEAHHGCNYSLFKKGIRPIWEDPMNRRGGRFVFTITKESDQAYKCVADRMWLEFSMAVVGNVLPNVSHQICGIIGGNRNNMIKIAVWTRDCENVNELKQIGQYFKRISHYKAMVPYEVHMDSSQMARSTAGGGGTSSISSSGGTSSNGKTLFKI